MTVRLEFSRKVLPGANAPVGGGAELTMSFGNMALEGGKAGPQEAAEMIVRRGFGSVTNAREGEERSSLMGQLMDAEEYARVRVTEPCTCTCLCATVCDCTGRSDLLCVGARPFSVPEQCQALHSRTVELYRRPQGTCHTHPSCICQHAATGSCLVGKWS